MKLNYKLTLLVIAFCLPMVVFSQKSKTEAADRAFNNYQYAEAADLYKEAYTKVKGNKVEKNRILFQIAKSYEMAGVDKKAMQNYLKLYKINYQKDDPSILLSLAELSKRAQEPDYAKAVEYYNEYIKLRPNDKKGLVGKEGAELAQQWLDNPTRYEIENMKKINTKSNDWSPAFKGTKKNYNSLVFSSNQEGASGSKSDGWTGAAFSDFFISTKGKSKGEVDFPGDWAKPIPIEGEDSKTIVLNLENVNEGEACFNTKGNTVYFTRCLNEKKKVNGCRIYQSSMKGKSWDDAQLIELGPDSCNYVHPAISEDELVLYFASDMAGGEGGYDLWMVKRDRKSKPFGKPVNLGKQVNTFSHEMFPTLRDDNTLYFSSKGLPGMGGFDIYKTTMNENGEWSTPENLKAPLNSQGDDFGIVFDGSNVNDPSTGNPYTEKGFFTSNRSGGKGGDDIWAFKLRPLIFTLSGVVRDSVTNALVADATVLLTASDGNVYKIQTDNKGYYMFNKTQILPELTFDIAVSKQGYYENDNSRGKETTVGLRESKDLKKDFLINPFEKAPIVLPEILYDYDKYDLKPQYHDSLAGLYKTLVDNPTIVIELSSHTDARGSVEYNETLSQHRAESCVDYLIGKGIEADRMVAKGYGKSAPRVLNRDFVFEKDGKTYTFKKGTKLTEAYIKSLRDKQEQEYAHQLNRRSEFKILRDNYVPAAKNDSVAKKQKVTIQIVNAAKTPKTQEIAVEVNEKNVMTSKVTVNGSTEYSAVIKAKVSKVTMSLAEVNKLYKAGVLKVRDFEDADAAIDKNTNTVLPNAKFYLSELSFGEVYVENVEVTASKTQKEPITVGDGYLVNEVGKFSYNKETKKLVFEAK